MGAAMTGLRPVAELMFSDFFAVTWDMVANQIAKTALHDRRPGVAARSCSGRRTASGLRFGAQHSQSVENWAMAIPGLKVVAPSTPADVVGLMAAAIRDPDPVIFCESKSLFATKGEVPDGEHVVPLGQGGPSSGKGSDCTIIALAAMVPRARGSSQDRLAADHGISAEVIDLRWPRAAGQRRRSWHRSRKTSRLFTVEENPRLVRLGPRRSCRSWPTRAFYSLDAAAGTGSPRPTSRCRRRQALEDLAVPSVDRIAETVRLRLEQAK